MSKKTIAIISGGLDSAVLLYHLQASGVEVKALSFNYGQRHKKELEYAKKLTASIGVDHKVVDLSSITQLLGGSSQTDPTIEVPEGHYAAENMKITVVSQRNLIMLSLAAAWAVSLKYDSVAFAAHAGDHAIYPDCRNEFVDALDKTVKLGDWHQVGIERPFVHMTKAEIVSLGDKLGLDFSSTWSCYKGGEIHCGRCGTCQERVWAFDAARVKDPTIYIDREAYKSFPAPAEFAK